MVTCAPLEPWVGSATPAAHLFCRTVVSQKKVEVCSHHFDVDNGWATMASYLTKASEIDNHLDSPKTFVEISGDE